MGIKGKAGILCIDDQPDKIIGSSKKPLNLTIKSMFKEANYNVYFEKCGPDGIKAVRKNRDIKLVLLDIHFEGKYSKMQGSQIADELYKINPDIKVVFLTIDESHGKKRSMGWKPNKAGYVVKDKLATEGNRVLFMNLIGGLVNDPLNEKWVLRLNREKQNATLRKSDFECFFKLSRDKWLLLEACAKKPNEDVYGAEIEDYKSGSGYVNRDLFDINELVINKTQWKMSRLLVAQRGNSSARMIIGKVENNQEEEISPSQKTKNKYVTVKQFEELKKEVMEIKELLMSKLQ